MRACPAVVVCGRTKPYARPRALRIPSRAQLDDGRVDVEPVVKLMGPSPEEGGPTAGYSGSGGGGQLQRLLEYRCNRCATAAAARFVVLWWWGRLSYGAWNAADVAVTGPRWTRMCRERR